jgi:membrane protease YdiL (CAAX protease family)
MIFRSLLLSLLLKLGLSKNKTIILPALIFSLFHLVFYSYIMLPENRGSINLQTLITLFMFGVAANSLFLKFRNIYFPWALHCGWNMHRFGSKIVSIGEIDFRKGIQEYMTFNLLEGGTPIMILSIFLAATCLASSAKNIVLNGKI